MRALKINHQPKSFADYLVHEVLGYGAHSTIYKVLHPDEEKLYALKHVVVQDRSHRRFIHQVENEFEVAQRIDHRRVRRCHKLVRIRSLLQTKEAWVIMDYIEGTSLFERKPNDLITLVLIFLRMARALQAFGDAGFVHADIKPQNILRTSEGGVRVIDLGQACAIGTMKKRMQGTPDYIAPEQVLRRPITSQTDMFNFGATLYWALTDRNIPSLVQEDLKSLLSRRRPRMFFPPESYRPEIPSSLSLLVGELLCTSPSDRPSDWTVVCNRLNLIWHQLQRRGAQKLSVCRERLLR